MYLTLTLKQTSPALGLPVGLVYLAVPLSGLLIVYYGIQNVLAGQPDLTESAETKAA